MRSETSARALAGIALLAAMACGHVAEAQQAPDLPQQLPSPPAPPAQKTTTNVPTPCVQPPPTVNLQDYDGPLQKTVGLFARKLELKAVHPQHYKPGLTLCSLDLHDKFFLFVHDTFDPVTFISVGFIAGINQAENADPSFEQGATGYGKRFGASFIDQASFKFFKDFTYPAIFHEDPRYYRLIQGSNGRRLLHAVNHAFVAQRDNGNHMFNFSEWLGTTSVVTLSNAYHLGNRGTFGPTSEQVGFNIAEDMGFDVLREFWPDIAHKLRLPFRVEPVPDNSGPNPAAK